MTVSKLEQATTLHSLSAAYVALSAYNRLCSSAAVMWWPLNVPVCVEDVLGGYHGEYVRLHLIQGKLRR